MLEIFNENTLLKVKNSDNKVIVVDTVNKKVSIDDFGIDYPGEYEKSWILSEVFEYEQKLFYSIHNEQKLIMVIFDEVNEIKEELLEFFGDVDVLLVAWTKNMQKLIENIETRVVIPFGEGKDVLLNTLWQHKEEISSFKLKQEMWEENTEYVNLAL